MHVHPPPLIFPSWWNVRLKGAIATLCVLWKCDTPFNTVHHVVYSSFRIHNTISRKWKKQRGQRISLCAEGQKQQFIEEGNVGKTSKVFFRGAEAAVYRRRKCRKNQQGIF